MSTEQEPQKPREVGLFRWLGNKVQQLTKGSEDEPSYVTHLPSDAPTSHDLSGIVTEQDWADIEEIADKLRYGAYQNEPSSIDSPEQ